VSEFPSTSSSLAIGSDPTGAGTGGQADG